MKLANEAAEEIVTGIRYAVPEMEAARVAAIIAAKLESVIGILHGIKDAADGVEEPSNYDNMPTRWVTIADLALSAISQASKTALAMLSEEEKG